MTDETMGAVSGDSDTQSQYKAHYIQQHTTRNHGSFCIIFEDTGMGRKTTFRPTTDRIHDGGPIILLHYNTYHCVTIAYSIQYSNMLYRFVA